MLWFQAKLFTAAQKMHVIFSILYVWHIESLAYLEDAVSAYYENMYTPIYKTLQLSTWNKPLNLRSQNPGGNKYFFCLQKIVITRAVSSPMSIFQIYYDIVPMLCLREDQELFIVWTFSKGYGPCRAREYFYHTSVLTTVNTGSWHV